MNNIRGVRKQHMVHNAYLPRMEVDPQTYAVRADGQLLVCEPATSSAHDPTLLSSVLRLQGWHRSLPTGGSSPRLMTSHPCSKLMPRARPGPVLVQRASTLELDWDTRQKSRFRRDRLPGPRTRRFSATRHRGARRRCAGGRRRLAGRVSSPRRKPCLRITPAAAHGTPFDLTRAAYHLGNRHVPIELKPDHLKIEPDHVLADMLRSMHMTVKQVV